jgi:hypothetical protein
MIDSPEAGRSLNREDLLKAIDFEIGHRESILSRHGLSIWGILVALAALSWAALSEVFDATHNWTVVLFLMLVGRFVLGFLASPLVKTFGIGVQIEPANGRGTFQEKLFRHGMNPEILPFVSIDFGLMLATSIYLGMRGLYLIAVLSGTFYLLLLLGIAFIWLLSRIRVPIKVPVKKARPNSLLMKVLIVQAVLIAVNALTELWPIHKADAKLGIILSGLTSLYGTAITLLQPPPTTDRLRSIRSRLALGKVTTLAAIQQIDRVIDGSPEEQYLSEKADALISELQEYVRLAEELEIRARKMIALANKFRATGSDEKVLREVASDYQPLFFKITSAFKAMDHQTQTIVKLRAEFGLRVDASKTFLNLKPEAVTPIFAGINQAEKDMAAAKKKFVEFGDDFKEAADLLFKSQKDFILPKEKEAKFKKVYAALFQD